MSSKYANKQKEWCKLGILLRKNILLRTIRKNKNVKIISFNLIIFYNIDIGF